MAKACLLLLLIFSANLSIAGDQSWTTIGPYGRPEPILYHPQNSNILYSAGYGNFFRSLDSGQTWSRINLPDELTLFRVHEKTPHDIVGAYVDYDLLKIFRSTNEGSTWFRVSTKRLVTAYSQIQDFEIDPANPEIMYISAFGAGIYKSTNGGKSWTRKSTGLPEPKYFSAKIELHPRIRNVAYVLLIASPKQPFAVAKTDNGGQSWKIQSNGLPFPDARESQFEIDPKSGNILYFASKGVFRSFDEGRTWSSSKLSETYVTNIAIDPKAPRRILVVGARVNIFGRTTQQSFLSENFGESWKGIFFQRLEDPVFASFHPSQNLLFVGGIHLLGSANGGKLWKKTDLGINNVSVSGLDFNKNLAFRILAGGEGVFERLKQTNQWKLLFVSNRFSTVIVKSNPKRPTVLGMLNGSNGSFSLSVNSGKNWKVSENTFPGADFAFHPQKEEVIYFLSGKSTNLGRTSKDFLNLEGDRRNVKPDPTNGDVVYIVADQLYRSTNQGQNWTKLRVARPGELRSIEIDPLHTNVLFLLAYNGIWKSTDGGTTWIRNLGNGDTTSLAIDSVDSNTLFGITGKLQMSTDAGQSWRDFDQSGLDPEAELHFIFVDPSDHRTLYITTDRGVFSYTRR